MPTLEPKLIIRIGSHAEKEYVLKLSRFMSGIIIGANLLEATSGATASLLLRICGGDSKVAFYLDPMTYAYGAYIDPETGARRTDLDWIKSDQTVPEDRGRKAGKGRKRTTREFKRSYRRLAENLGAPIQDAVQTSTAVSSKAFNSDALIQQFCGSAISYQLERIAQEFEREEELKDFVGQVPPPAAVFAPYFYVEPTARDEWFELNLKLMTSSAKIGQSVPVHGVLCADRSHLRNASFCRRVAESIPGTGVSGVWLWFSEFSEDDADDGELVAYRSLVETLAKRVEVYSMHGGFFSLALSKLGMTGVSHGIGYGEQKDVVPIIGQSTPWVRYYLPAFHRRLGVPDIERAFDALGIKTPQDFHRMVCACAVCRGIVESSLSQFQEFGEVHYSRPDSKRMAQTPAAAKKCRLHFLLARLEECTRVSEASIEDLVTEMREAANNWGAQPSLRGASSHLERWAAELSRLG